MKVPRICVECGRTFRSSNEEALYCPGGACKQKAYRRTHKARKAILREFVHSRI